MASNRDEDVPENHYPRDQGQIGAIIQTRLCQKGKTKLWCRLGSICITRKNDNREAVTNDRKRRRIDDDAKLMEVTPDASTEDLNDIDFVGISLTDIPCSPLSESMAYRFPDACGRVAVQISGIATIPVAENALEKVDNLKIGDNLSIDTTNLMEFTDDEKTVGLQNTEENNNKMHYIGMVCNINLSPTTGPSIDVLLCPQRYVSKLQGNPLTIDAEKVNSDFLADKWELFEKKANAASATNPFTAVKAKIREAITNDEHKTELLGVITELESSRSGHITCPAENQISFFGKLTFFLGTQHDGTLPGLADAILDNVDIEVIVSDIKAKVTDDVYDSENSAIFCKSSEEVQWIKAWESWANEHRKTYPVNATRTFADKLDALNTFFV